MTGLVVEAVYSTGTMAYLIVEAVQLTSREETEAGYSGEDADKDLAAEVSRRYVKLPAMQ